MTHFKPAENAPFCLACRLPFAAHVEAVCPEGICGFCSVPHGGHHPECEKAPSNTVAERLTAVLHSLEGARYVARRVRASARESVRLDYWLEARAPFNH